MRPTTLFIGGLIALNLWVSTIGWLVVQTVTGSHQAQQIAAQAQQLASQQRQLTQIVVNQAHNRAANVASWCTAINQNRDAERSILVRYHLQLGIGNLDCKQLIAKTLASTHAAKK